MIELLVLAGLALTLGVYLAVNYSGTSDTLGDVLRVTSSVFWILSGVFAILGGFILLGFGLILVFTFVGTGAALDLRKEAARKRISGG